MKCIRQGDYIIKRRLANGEIEVEGARFIGSVDCRCGAEVELYQDIDAWEPETGKIVDWGPGQGVCDPCGLLYVDSWDGMTVYKLREESKV